MAKDRRLRTALAGLKITLMQLQRERCAYCGKQQAVMDFHHTLLRESRGRTVEQKLALLSPLNGRLVCHACHVPEPPDLTYRCCIVLIQVYGADSLEHWVAHLQIKDKGLPMAYYTAKDYFQVIQDDSNTLTGGTNGNT